MAELNLRDKLLSLTRDISADSKTLAKFSNQLLPYNDSAAQRNLRDDIASIRESQKLRVDYLEQAAKNATQKVAAELLGAAHKLRDAETAEAIRQIHKAIAAIRPDDLLTTDDIRRLADVSVKSIQNLAGTWRKDGCEKGDRWSYSALRPLLLLKWPHRAYVLDADIEAVRAFLEHTE